MVYQVKERLEFIGYICRFVIIKFILENDFKYLKQLVGNGVNKQEVVVIIVVDYSYNNYYYDENMK